MHLLFTVAAAMTWAISPQWLSTILTIANREGAGPEAVAKELGRPLENTREVTRRDGVAIIPVIGPIFRRANMLSEISGATSVQVLATDLHIALDADEVEAIVLEIDSPGGEANGICELADMVYAARGRKPIVAYVGGDGASAAYWLASACDRIYLSDTASVGSIGVVRAVPNPKADSAKGIEIVSSQSPNKRPDVLTDEGRKVYQDEVDALADVFVARVARNRGVTVDEVLERFGGGACLVGEHAVKVGLADEVSSFEAVVASLQKSDPAEQASPPAALASAVKQPHAAARGQIPSPKENGSMSKRNPMVALATIAAMATAASGAPPDGSDDDKNPKANEDEMAERDPVFQVDDQVIAGDRPAKITEVRNGPHYAIEFLDEEGGNFQWASEDELAASEGTGAEDEEDEPSAEEDEDQSPAAIRARAKARALAAENKRLRAQLLGSKRAAKTNGIESIVAQAKAEKKLTPALERELRKIGAMSLPAAKALAGALPRIAALANFRTQPRKQGGPVDMLFKGKAYGELSFSEKHELATTDKDLFDKMKLAHEAEKAEAAKG